MSEAEMEYNPKCRQLGLHEAEQVGRANLAVSLGIDLGDLNVLLDTDVVWPQEMVEVLLAFVSRRDRRKNGEAGFGPGETTWEVSHRGAMESAARAVVDDEETPAEEGAEEVDEWALPVRPAAEQVELEVDPALLQKAAHVLDLYALLEAGRRRLWDPKVSDRVWREISEVLCSLELVMIMDFSADPEGSVEEWDRWRCQREAEVRWSRLRELRRAMEQGWRGRIWRFLLGRKKRNWLAVLMRDVDRGTADEGVPMNGEAAEWLGMSGVLEQRWEQRGRKGRRGRR